MAFTFAEQTRAAACAVALGGMALTVAVMRAHAQGGAYPAKPVTLVVAFPPGGMTDIVSRALAKELQQNLKQPFVVENRPGGAGQVGTEYVARQPADGYTLLVGATGYVIAPAMKKVGYDPLKSLEPVAVLARAPNLIVVNPSVPVKNTQEFLAWAKTQSNIPFGTTGAAGSTHLGGEWLRKATGYQFNHVPYKGAAPATNDAGKPWSRPMPPTRSSGCAGGSRDNMAAAPGAANWRASASPRPATIACRSSRAKPFSARRSMSRTGTGASILMRRGS